MRRLLAGVVLCLLMVATAGQAEAAQDFRLSKRAKNFNFDVRTATNPDSGAVLVVWTELKPADSNYARVWASLLKRKKNGTYKRKKDVLISPNTGYHINADVAWVKEAKAFAVVWDTRRVPGTDSDVLGRFVSPKKGKPVGPVRTLQGTGDAEFSPLLVVNNTVEDGAPIELLFLREPLSARGADDIKEMTHALFDFEFNPRGEITAMSDLGAGEANFEFGLRVEDDLVLYVLNCGVVVVNEFDGGRQFLDIYLVRDGVASLEHSYADATFSDLTIEGEGNATAIRVARQQEGNFDLDTDRFLVQGRWESLRLRPRDAETLDFEEVTAPPGPRLLLDDSLPARSRFNPLRSGVASVDSETRLFGFGTRRSLSTPGTTLFSHEGKLTDLGGRVIPQTEQQRTQAEPADALVWWLKNAGGSKQQVWVHLFATSE